VAAPAGARPTDPSLRQPVLQDLAERSVPLKDIILDYIRREYLDEDERDDVALDENTRLVSSGIVDSFSMVSLKRFLEKQYNVAIPDAEATPAAFDTVASIIQLVNKHRRSA
jgi:acyl carrier protein